MSVARDTVYAAVVLLTSPVWGYRLLRTGKWRTDWPGRFGHGDTPAPTDGRTLLIHAVSVGEVNAIRLMVNKLSAADPALRIVISTTTNTGTARARELFEPTHHVVRYPFDFGPCVHRFLDRLRPDAVALVELEVWPNFISECRRRNIRVCVVNGRLSARSYRGYRLIRPLVRPTFAALAYAAVQNRPIAERFIALGTPADQVRVLDTMKWDTATVADHVDGSDQLARAMGLDRSRPIIVAGSTGPGEERLLIDTCPPQAQLVLVPRKPERFDEAAALARGIIRRSQHPDGSERQLDSQRLFLLDTMGELRKAYALADVVIIGRSFLGLYGSDMIEPIALGKPTIIGRCYSDFAHVMAALIAAKGIEVTDQPGPLAATLLADPARADQLAENGRRVILSRQGATGRHAQMLLELLKNAPMTGSTRGRQPKVRESQSET